MSVYEIYNHKLFELITLNRCDFSNASLCQMKYSFSHHPIQLKARIQSST